MNLETIKEIAIEKSYLGNILFSGRKGIVHGLSPDDFYLASHKRIYSVMLDLFYRGLEIEGETVLRETKLFREVSELIDSAGAVVNNRAYADIIKDAAHKRGLQQVAMELLGTIADGKTAKEKAYSVIDTVSQLIAPTTGFDTGIDNDGLLTGQDLALIYAEHVKSLANGGVTTSIPTIDKHIRRVAKGEVMTVLARPGCFKTAFLQNMLLNFNRENECAVFFSLEMPAAGVYERFVQNITSSPGASIELQEGMGVRTVEEHKAINKAMKDIYVVTTRPTIGQMIYECEKAERKSGKPVGLVGIDYLGLVSDAGKTEYERNSKIATNVKIFAKKKNVPVVLLSQLNRSAGDGTLPVTLDMARGCFDSNTEILTEQGWKYFDDLAPSDKVLSADKETLTAFYTKPTRRIKYEYNGVMFANANHSSDFMVTPNHNLFERHERSAKYQLEEIQKIKVKMVRIPRTFKWKGKKQEYFILPGSQLKIKMRPFLSFLGWFLSEGSASRTIPRIIVSQRKRKNIRTIELLFESLPFNYSVSKDRRGEYKFQITDKHLWGYLSKFGKQSVRTIPRFVHSLESSSIKVFLDAYLSGDGSTHKGTRYYYTSSKAMADSLQELILKTGKYSQVMKGAVAGSKGSIEGRTITRTADMFTVSEWRSVSDACLRMDKIDKIPYRGYVHCVTVEPSHLIYVRRNGKCLWSGNSGQVEEAADFILGFHRPKLEGNPNPAVAYIGCGILKNRIGATIDNLAFGVKPSIMQFCEVEVEAPTGKENKKDNWDELFKK